MEPDIELFSIDGCPDCLALKRWFAARRIPYRLRDLSDPAVQAEAKARTGLRVAPITIIDGQPIWGIATAQIPRIMSLLDTSRRRTDIA